MKVVKEVKQKQIVLWINYQKFQKCLWFSHKTIKELADLEKILLHMFLEFLKMKLDKPNQPSYSMMQNS